MGTLSGLRVLELEGIGPAPFSGMMLCDHGADVIVIDRPEAPALGLAQNRKNDVRFRGRRSVVADLKSEEGKTCVLALIAKADVLIEGFRPRTMERLGLGPQECLKLNPRLIYGRMTGWGQTGPLAGTAGHDLNYISLTGILNAVGRHGQPPSIPLNLIGDYGGGGLFLAYGILCALFERAVSGQGQVVDAAMMEGSSTLAAQFFAMTSNGAWGLQRGTNILDSGAPWYDVYECADAKYVAVGAVEDKFYNQLLEGLELNQENIPDRREEANWEALRAIFTARFRQRTRDAWTALFDGTDACVTPVLDFLEAPHHPHAVARNLFDEEGGAVWPRPGPVFSRTPADARSAPPERGEGGRDALRDWGFDNSQIEAFRAKGLRFT